MANAKRLAEFLVIISLVIFIAAQRVHVNKNSPHVTATHSLWKDHLHQLDNLDERSNQHSRGKDEGRRYHSLPPVDLAKAFLEDEEETLLYGKAIPGGMRFGVPLSVALNSDEHGLWTKTTPNNFRDQRTQLERNGGEVDSLQIWTLQVITQASNSTLTASRDEIGSIPVAHKKIHTISLEFDKLSFGEGGLLWIEGRDGVTLGPYSEGNLRSGNKGKMLQVQPVPGDFATVVYTQPIGLSTSLPHLSISTVIAGYRNLLPVSFDKSEKRIGSDGAAVSPRFTVDISGSCHVDVCNSPNYRNKPQHNGVVLLVSGNARFCSASLVANAERECSTPYILTAAHCISQSAGTSTGFIALFNFEKDCQGSEIPMDHTCAGMTVVAKRSQSDVALLQLEDCPVDALQEYKSYFNGIDLSPHAPPGVYGIHHPRGDVKKWSLEDDNNAIGVLSETLKILEWSRGSTEAGSSGSPLFALHNDLIVGQLWRGSESCTCNSGSCYDEYGRIHRSWATSSIPTEQLAVHLNPKNQPLSFIEGYPCPSEYLGIVPGAVEMCYGDISAVIVTVTNYGVADCTFSAAFIGPETSPFSSQSFAYPNSQTFAKYEENAVLRLQLQRNVPEFDTPTRDFLIEVLRNPLSGARSEKFDRVMLPITMTRRAPSVSVLTPHDGSSIDYISTMGSILVNWTTSMQTTSYRLEASTSAENFQENLFQSTNFQNSLERTFIVSELRIPFAWRPYSIFWRVIGYNKCSVDGVMTDLHELVVRAMPLSCREFSPPLMIPDVTDFLTLDIPYTNVMIGMVVQLSHPSAKDVRMNVDGPGGRVVLQGATACGAGVGYCADYPAIFMDDGVPFDCTLTATGKCAAMENIFGPYNVGNFELAFGVGMENIMEEEVEEEVRREGGVAKFNYRDRLAENSGSLLKVCAIEADHVLLLTPFHLYLCSATSRHPPMTITSSTGIISSPDISKFFCFISREEWDSSQAVPSCSIRLGDSGEPELHIATVCPQCSGTVAIQVVQLLANDSPSVPPSSKEDLKQFSQRVGIAKASFSAFAPVSFSLISPGSSSSTTAPVLENPITFRWQSAGSVGTLSYTLSIYNKLGGLMHEVHSLSSPEYEWRYTEAIVHDTSMYSWSVLAHNLCGIQQSNIFYFRPKEKCVVSGTSCASAANCCSGVCKGGRCR